MNTTRNDRVAFNQLLKDSNDLIELQWRLQSGYREVAKLIEKIGELEDENKLLKANTNENANFNTQLFTT